MIYFDNASTSFPKTPGLSDCVKKYVEESCYNVGRGSYSKALLSSQMVFETRELLSRFFSAKSSKNVVFTSGVTQSINLALKGVLKPGDKVLVSTMEHNAVMRPLKQLERNGIELVFFNCGENGEANRKDLVEKFNCKPKMLISTHASNVCGTIMPIGEMGNLCKQSGALFVVDSAQTGGVLNINMTESNIDVLCFSGHKGFLSLQGIGGAVFSERAAKVVEPIIFGGTGSFSDLLEMPTLLPDKFEAGTLNLPGIAAFNHSIRYLNSVGIENIYNSEMGLLEYFESGLEEIRSIKKVNSNCKNRCAVSSINSLKLDDGVLSYRLDSEHEIMVRSGLHCAPLAHKTLGTFPRGTVRVSFGYSNTKKEIDILLSALKKL